MMLKSLSKAVTGNNDALGLQAIVNRIEDNEEEEEETKVEYAQNPVAEYNRVMPTFVSEHVRKHCIQLAKQRKKSSSKPVAREPSAESSFAAVMMADVSGYSTLSAVLAERGPMGADIMGKTIKSYLDKIISLIISHDGDIVKFAGDAVIVYWKPAPNETVTDITRGELVLKASYCCMDLLNQLGTFDIDVPDCSIKQLRLHLGIGAGQIYDVHVGAGARWEHFIAGDGIRQLSQVLNLASSGELAMSHAALKYFSSVIDIDTMKVGGYDKRCVIIHGLERARRKIPWIKPPVFNTITDQDISASIDIMEIYTSTAAIHKLKADINQSNIFKSPSDIISLMKLHEIRQVTTVFIKLDGGISKWEKKDSLQVAQRVLVDVLAALTKYEGSLRQFHVDDKGAVILAFFGLPPLSHQNDASHAIRAVLDMCQRLREYLDEFSIGVTTGDVSLGGVGAKKKNRICSDG